MKKDLVARVQGILNEAGFLVSSLCEARSFDLAARREEVTLLAKILHNIDSFREEVARSIKRAAFCLLASPIVLGERRGGSVLEDDVVYYRYGIPALNAHTLYDHFVEGVQPLVYSATGGLFVNIDGAAMREAREKKNFSLGDVAAELGVSRRSVSKYEEGGASTAVEIALRLEEILRVGLILPLDFLKSERPSPLSALGAEARAEARAEGGVRAGAGVEEAGSGLEKDILGVLEEIGFEIFRTAYAPFSAVSESGGVKILTGVSKYTARMIKRAKITSSLSEVTRTKSVFVVNGKVRRVQIENTVLIEKEELKKMRDTEEFACLLEERAEG